MRPQDIPQARLDLILPAPPDLPSRTPDQVRRLLAARRSASDQLRRVFCSDPWASRPERDSAIANVCRAYVASCDRILSTGANNARPG